MKFHIPDVKRFTEAPKEAYALAAIALTVALLALWVSAATNRRTGK
jgi:uncharacterized membrane protein YhdT